MAIKKGYPSDTGNIVNKSQRNKNPQKTTKLSDMNPIIIRGWTNVISKISGASFLLKQYINIISFNYQNWLMQIIVCLFMGGHEISIKRIFDFRTSLPKNKILYIKYINGKRKQSHRKKGHRIKSHKTRRKKSHKNKSQEKKSQEKKSPS
jgi:hypothetical protein